MTEEEQRQSEQAVLWVKANKKIILEKFATGLEYVADLQPTTLFMAGSPGAGKTEISKWLVPRFKQKPIRIDADEIRVVCPGYAGSNAHIFQDAATKGVHILYDYAIEKNINVILDGTFAYKRALENIKRSLDHGRKVEIFFVYQDPLQAWSFTKKREALEHRRVSKEVFIEAFFKSRENVNEAKSVFGSQIELNLIIKDFEKDLEGLEINITEIDRYIKKSYTKSELEEILS
jgi:predicted ABC-type ATPase